MVRGTGMGALHSRAGLVRFEVESGNSLEVPVPGHENRSMLADDRGDKEIEVADRDSFPVQLSSQSSGVVGRVRL